MPKINVYLPDDLASSVKSAGIPVSAVCQSALATAVRAVQRTRRMATAIRDPEADPEQLTRIVAEVSTRFTPRLQDSLRLAREASAAMELLSSTHLLLGILDEGDNLAVRLMGALGVDLDDLRVRVGALARGPAPRHPDPPLPSVDAPADTRAGGGLDWPARQALAAAMEAAITLGHNYCGCEHLLIGLIDDQTGGVGDLLQRAGLDANSVRSAVGTATVGFSLARTTLDAADRDMMADLRRRLDRIESRLGPEEG